MDDELIEMNEGFTKCTNDTDKEMDDEDKQSFKFDFYSCTLVLKCAVYLEDDGNREKRTYKKSSGTNAMLLHVKNEHNFLWDK